jgi:hypothetical protein
MVREGLVFGHRVSEKGVEVDDSRIVALKRLPIPHGVKGVKISLDMQGSIGVLLRTLPILILL